MASHPYISGPGNIAQMVAYLRKNFPANVTSDTVKKFGLAPKGESYIINALQFIGIIDQEGKRTEAGQDVFVLGDDDFPKAFEGLIRTAYTDLFETRGEDAWTMTKSQLIGYFRATDKTSEIIGSRQAGVFTTFCALAGHVSSGDAAVKVTSGKLKQSKPKATIAKSAKVDGVETSAKPAVELNGVNGRRNMALTVRIEINLPAGGSKETYDNIFKSIRANLIDE